MHVHMHFIYVNNPGNSISRCWEWTLGLVCQSEYLESKIETESTCRWIYTQCQVSDCRFNFQNQESLTISLPESRLQQKEARSEEFKRQKAPIMICGSLILLLWPPEHVLYSAATIFKTAFVTLHNINLQFPNGTSCFTLQQFEHCGLLRNRARHWNVFPSGDPCAPRCTFGIKGGHTFLLCSPFNKAFGDGSFMHKCKQRYKEQQQCSSTRRRPHEPTPVLSHSD